MRLVRKIILFFIIAIVVANTLMAAVPKNIYFHSKSDYNTNIINVEVVFYTYDDPFVIALKQSLENIQEKNKEKIKFNFYNSKNNEEVQHENIHEVLEERKVDLLILSLVDLINDPKEVIEKVKEKNIPVIFASKRAAKIDTNVIESYDKAYYVVPDSEQEGRLQGKILVDLWNNNKDIVDMNNDNIMQYIMLEGEPKTIETIYRTKYSIMEIKDAGIKVEELAEKPCNWNEDIAKEVTNGLFIQYGNKIEAIIANNDAMAIGAIKTLQKYGDNKGSGTKTISVVGVDGISEAQNFIKKGFMSGTIYLDPNVMADAFYTVGMHLVHNSMRIDCSKDYKCDESGKIIQLPYSIYKF